MARPKSSEGYSTREWALKSASELLHARGFLGISMDEVAKAAGIRKASLYHHFPGGKEQMVLELSLQVLTAFEAGLLEALTGRVGVRDKLTALLHWRLAGPPGTERRLREAAGHMSPQSQGQIFGALIGQLFAPIHAVFVQGVLEGELRAHNTRLVSSAFMAVLSELGELGQTPSSAAEIEDVVKLFLEGVGAAPTSVEPSAG